MPRDEYGYYQRKRSNTDKIPLIMLLVFLAVIILMDFFMKLNLNWVDYTIIGIVFFCAFVGYVRGLIGAVFSLVGYILAVVCAVFFSEPLAVLIMEKTQIGQAVENALTDAYSNFTIPAFNESIDFDNIRLLENHPELQEFLQENMMFGQLFESVNPLESGAEALGRAVTSITDLLVFSILKVISIILIFLIIKMIVSIISRIINSLISFSSFLSTTNKTVGLVLGAIIGCMLVFIAVSYVIPFIGSMNIVNMPDEYGNSRVLMYIFTSPPEI